MDDTNLEVRRDGRILPDLGDLRVVGQHQPPQDEVLHQRVEDQERDAQDRRQNGAKYETWKKDS